MSADADVQPPPRHPDGREGRRRGHKTRAALIAAARVVFERDGFLDAKVNDIPAEAGVAAGSFYTHFTDKRAIFKALVEELQVEMLYPTMDFDGVEHGDVRQAIERSNRAYLAAYRENARLMALFEEMTLIDAEFRALRLRRARAFTERSSHTIRQLQQAGRIAPGVDPEVVARALSSMVSRFAQVVYVWGEDVDTEDLVKALSYIWSAALGLTSAPAEQSR